MGFILYILSRLLSAVVITLGILYGLIRCFWGHQIGVALKSVNQKFMIMATSIDKYGNVACKELFNDVLIKPHSLNPFGYIEQTISIVLGHNQIFGTLSRTGKAVVWLLDKIEKDHCKKWALKDKFIINKG
jgi:hypothetical protein